MKYIFLLYANYYNTNFILFLYIRKMIKAREGRAIYDIFNIGNLDFIINDLCVN